tara:strand:- start:655 stop:837 length:183 start_codon:yes stop_codon:yes gene_type:complete
LCYEKKNISQKEPHSFSDFAEFSAFVGKDKIKVAVEEPGIRLNELFSNFQRVKAAGGLLI